MKRSESQFTFGAEWGAERPEAPKPTRPTASLGDFVAGLLWVLLLLVALPCLARLVTGEWPFAAQAAEVSHVFGDGFETPGSGGGEPIDYCADPLVNPVGFQRSDKTWTQTFSAPDGHPSAIYPAGVAFPTPVGAEVGTFRVVPFVPFQNQTVNLYWDQVQARPQDGYYRARPARSMFFAITPCYQIYGRVIVPGDFGQVVLGSGDLRAPRPNAPDPFQRTGCRDMENSASVIWTTNPAVATETNEYVCVLQAGITYYLIIAAVDPRDGIDPGEETCELEGAPGCDVGVRLQSSTSTKDGQGWVVRKAFGIQP